jgi:hypothetical protein
MASEFTPRCPSCYGNDLEPVPCQPYGLLELHACWGCGNIWDVTGLVELREMEPTTARNESREIFLCNPLNDFIVINRRFPEDVLYV